MPTLSSIRKTVVAGARTVVFVAKVLPMLPSRPLNLITPAPVVETISYPVSGGSATGQVYRPARGGAHPGLVVCLGVVPFGVDHPQVPRLGEALARSGFAALMYWSPAMRDFRLDPEDIGNIALAYEHLIDQPYVDARRSGLLGTCVGGSFALMAAAHPAVRDRVAFVAAFAPYGSLLTLAPDIASAERGRPGERRSWDVDPLTRKVFVHSVTARLEAEEAERLRAAFSDGATSLPLEGMSDDGRAVAALLTTGTTAEALAATDRLPPDIRRGLDELSPVNYARDTRAPLIAISHDHDDNVIPVDESRRLVEAFAPGAVRYTEFAMFEHADPTKRKLSPVRMAVQLTRLYLWLHSIFRATVQ